MKFKYRINYEDLTKNFIDIVCGSMLMVIGLFLVDLFLPSTNVRVVNLGYIVIYVVVGCVIYFIYMWNTKSMKRVFGNRFSSKFNIFHNKKSTRI